jgi:hypothetical protein
MRKHQCRLDAGVEASGPHDFAVRFARVRLHRQSVHRIPRPTPVTIAKRPSCGRGTLRILPVIWARDQLRQIGTTGKSLEPDIGGCGGSMSAFEGRTDMPFAPSHFVFDAKRTLPQSDCLIILGLAGVWG